MELLRAGGPVIRVAHRGASALAPANTIASIREAAVAGADAVELDVIRDADRVVLCHSLPELVPDSPSLDNALELVRELGLGVQLDVKGEGYEEEVAAAVRRHGLLDFALASSWSTAALLGLARIEPRLRRSFTYPADRHGLSARRLTQPLVPAALATMRRALPARLPHILRRVGASAATLHFGVVSPAAIRRCHAAGIAVWAWTVNDAQVARRLVALGADAIIGDDPRILRGLSDPLEHT
jgi:glycerophosphoryl diester phosphodiesterase